MATARFKPGRLNLAVYREDDADIVLNIVNKQTRAVIDLTGYTFTAEARGSDGTLLQTFTDTLTDATGGVLTLSLSRTQTEALPDSCRWDLQAVTPGSKHQTWLTGTLTATGDVTDV